MERRKSNPADKGFSKVPFGEGVTAARFQVVFECNCFFFCFKSNIVELDFEYLYWVFMQTEINEGVRRDDPNALYLFANHYYSRDDRFDLPNMRGMRIAAAKATKKASDKGHIKASFLYDMIISGYPDIESEI